MLDTRAQLVALQMAFESLAELIDVNDGFCATYVEEMVICCLSSEVSPKLSRVYADQLTIIMVELWA